MIVVCKGKEDKDSILFKIRENDVVKFKRLPFNNYFYISKLNIESAYFFASQYIESIEPYGGYAKVILKNNFWRKKCVEELRISGIKTFEADVGSVKRFFIDNQEVKLNHDYLKKVYMDIETFDYGVYRKDIRDVTIADFPILSVALKDELGNEYFINNNALNDEFFQDFVKKYKPLLETNYFEVKKAINDNRDIILKKLLIGENQLLKDYYEIMKSYDLQLAYNGSKFDFSYIKQRMEMHGLDYYKLMLNDVDYMLIFKKDSFMNLKRWGLNKVSEAVFKDKIKDGAKGMEEVTKVDWKQKTPCKKYFELYLFYPEIMKEYNMQDVNLMLMMENELHFMNIHSLQSEISHCPIEDTVYNSRMCDYLMLNEKKKIGMVSESKPDAATVEMRSLVKPGGGYTFCNFPGVWKNITCYDYLSHYPTTMINFNISPEKFIKDVEPDLKSVFNEEELSYINYCINTSKAFIDKKGDLKKKDYEKRINFEAQVRNLNYNMWDLMWKFVENYDISIVKAKYPDAVLTPADINYDTKGWNIHPHRLFKNDSVGLVSGKTKDILFKRINVKNEIKFLKKNGDPENKIPGLNFMQNALKILINSFYGYFGFRNSRDYLFQIPDCITTSCRFITKKTMVESRRIELIPIWGDTDSCYFAKMDGSEIDIKTVNGFYFDFFKDWFKQFGTIVEFEKNHPVTNELVKVCHTTEFNYEKSLKNSIDIRKKKYYYLTPDDKIKMKGVSALKSDTLKTAADISRELAKSVLFEQFNMVEWKEKILSLKNKVYSFGLNDEEIFKFVSITKPLDAYGGSVIDGTTGKPKVKKDGNIQHSGVPAHIKVAKALKEKGVLVDVGDKLGYVIVKHKPRIEAISIDEYKENKRYDADYYWETIESSILEVLEIVCPNDVYDFFSECWSFSSKVQNRMKRELTERFLNYETIKVFGDMSSFNPMNEKCGVLFG